MKTSARFLAMLLAVLMIAGAAMTVSAASFSDVEEGYEHATAIATLAQLGVINGYDDGTFRPNDPVERDEMAKLVYVLYTTFTTAGAGNVKFNDVPAGNWATGFISWCAAKNIVGGYGDGTFRPDNNVTYDEALKMVCATLGYTDFDSSLWPVDVRQKGLRDLGLGEGLEDVNGSDKLTRGQVAQLLFNALDVDMNETKIDYVYDTSYVDGNGQPVKVKVPVEVAKTLAVDVWDYTKESLRVVGTENYVYNQLGTKGDEDTIKVVAVKEDGSLDTTVVAYDLDDLGLEAYEDNTDALIGLDIMTITKEGEMLANASVIGSVSVADVKIAGTDAAGVPYLDEVKINGEVYEDTKKENYFSNLKTLVYGTGTVTATAPFGPFVASGKTVDISYPHTAVVMDNNGDGVVDAIAVGYYAPYVVTKVENKKATSTVPAHVVYTYNTDLSATTGGTTIKSTDIADGKTLAKGDVFVAAKIGETMYIDAVVAPVNAAATRITSGAKASITLEGVGEVRYTEKGFKYFKGITETAEFDAATLLVNGDDGKPVTQDYYIYNDRVIYSTGASTIATSYDLALLLYVDKAGEATIVNNKVQQNFPAVLLIDGKQVKVNLKSITDGQGTLTGAQACADGSRFRIGTNGNGEAVYPYTLVSYTVDKKTGEYTLTTLADVNITDTLYVAANKAFSINANTGLIILDGKKVVLDENSVVYYTYVEDGETFIELGTYTAATMLKKFDATTTAQQAYLLDNEDGTYTLLATVLGDELTLSGTAAKRNYKNDARLIKYSVKGSAAEAIDGVAYYSYAFLNMDKMENGALTVDTTTSIEDGAIKAELGLFYGWDDVNEVYVEIGDTTTNIESVNVGTLTGVNANLGIVDINVNITMTGANAALNLADGIKLGADVKVWSTFEDDEEVYVTFDIATLEELFEEAADNSKTLDCAVGTYVDEEGDIQIAWIIVDNYYVVTDNQGNETYTQTYDVVGNINK